MLGGSRHHVFTVLSFIVLFLFQSFAWSADESSSGKSLARRLCVRALLLAGTFIAVNEVPKHYHDRRAEMQGKEHIGHGIYLDMAEVIDLLGPYEKRLLEKPEENTDQIASLFAVRLSGDYAHSPAFSVFPESRPAVTFFAGQSGERGVCRQKATLLAAILNHVQIPAQVESGLCPDLGVHCYVRLPHRGKVADPTEGRLYDEQEYYQDRKFIQTRPGIPFFSKGWY